MKYRKERKKIFVKLILRLIVSHLYYKIMHFFPHKRNIRFLFSIRRTLNLLQKIAPDDYCYPLVENLFPCKIMHDANQNDDQVIEFFNASLDDSQKNAVRFVLTTKNVISVIHGPPGITIFMVVRGVFRFFSNVCDGAFAKLINGSLSLIIFAESSFVDV